LYLARAFQLKFFDNVVHPSVTALYKFDTRDPRALFLGLLFWLSFLSHCLWPSQIEFPISISDARPPSWHLSSERRLPER